MKLAALERFKISHRLIIRIMAVAIIHFILGLTHALLVVAFTITLRTLTSIIQSSSNKIIITTLGKSIIIFLVKVAFTLKLSHFSHEKSPALGKSCIHP